MTKRLILHVFDRASGGVPEAILDFISNSPENTQHLVYGPADATIRPRLKHLATFFASNKNSILRPSEIKGILQKHPCSTIHAHSSISGAIVRIFFSKKKLNLVYSPHCFAFERTDIGSGKRFLFWAVEKLLSHNTSVIAACSIREKKLAESLAPRKLKVRFVPNVSRIAVSETKKTRELGPFTFVSVGRLSEQKNPARFAELTQWAAGHPGYKFVWVGDGDEFYKRELLSQKVEITGWLNEFHVEQRLKSSHVYVHVAKWEGFPLAILDAFNVGLPIIVDPIPAYGALESIQSIEFAWERISKDFKGFIVENRDAWAKTLAENTLLEQRNSLRSIWIED